VKKKCATCGHEYDESLDSCPKCAEGANGGIDISAEELRKGLSAIGDLAKGMEDLKRENVEMKTILKNVPEAGTKNHFSGGEPGQMDTRGETTKDSFQKLKNLRLGKYKDDGDRVKVKLANLYTKDVYGKSKGLTVADWDQMGGLVPTQTLPMQPVPGFGKIGSIVLQKSKIDMSGAFADMSCMNIKNVGSASLYGGITFSAVSENTGVGSQNEPSMQMIKFSPSERQGEALMSRKLMDSAPNAEAVLMDTFRNAFEYHVGYLCLQGTGTAEPLGWAKAKSTFAVERATANTIGFADLRGMRKRLYAQDPTSLYWFLSWSAWDAVASAEDGAGNPIFYQDYSKGVPPTLMNIPLIWAYETPYIGVEADANLVDLSMFGVGLGKDLTVFASEHRYAEKRAVYYIFYFDIDARPLVLDYIYLTDQSASSGDESSGFRISPQVILTDPSA